MTAAEKITTALEKSPGKVSCWAKNLLTGEEVAYHPTEKLLAASVIKIPILVECFAQMEEKRIDRHTLFTIHAADKMPSCGALNYMHDGLVVTLEDLYTLMIILSDNTATNLLIDYLGIEAVNARMASLGMKITHLNRRLFEPELARAGIENYIAAREIGDLLERMTLGTLVSPAASQEMLAILAKQRLNSKIPFMLPPGTRVAHKTGEDGGIAHDVAVVYGQQNFILCLCANEVEVAPFERKMQDIARLLYDEWK
jgi:beta-lactamase class A